MPPQGLLVLAAYLPGHWEIRFVDENLAPVEDADLQWCDVVLLSGMHVQRPHIEKAAMRARAFGKVTALGGPSVSACPEWYPFIDILHCGELGDATDELIAHLEKSVARPSRQMLLRTKERLPLADFPLPAYHMIEIERYFIGSIQWSSGCPYRCEFCDIPELYGRNPRLKTPQQVTAELDAMLSRGNPGAVYFVDDNIIGNQKAAIELLEHIGKWQKERGYPVQFACEGSLNISKNRQILELMKEAYFVTIFCGIETPEVEALRAMHKDQNLRTPLLESVEIINSYGLEIVSGIILGLDTDTPNTGEKILNFIEQSHIPMLTINILHALPKTPLWRRLSEAGRLVENPPADRESNVAFTLPYKVVEGMWLKCVTQAFQPEAIYERFRYQRERVYINRKKLPVTKARLNVHNVVKALRIMGRLFWHVGVLSDYRKLFWETVVASLKKGDIEGLIQTAVVSYHMILFARDCTTGQAEKCFYGGKEIEEKIAS